MSAAGIIPPLLLLSVANGAPVIAGLLLQDRFNRPLDGGICLADGRRLLGPSKTIRGIAAAIVSTALAAPLVHFSFVTGALVGFWAMAGDLCSSFIKRRCGLASSAGAPGLDHIPEALLPLWFLDSQMRIQWTELALIIFAFALLDLFLRQLLHLVFPGIRSR